MTLGGRSRLKIEYIQEWSQLSEESPHCIFDSPDRAGGFPSAVNVLGLSGQTAYRFVRANEPSTATGDFRPTGAAMSDGAELVWHQDEIVVSRNGYRYWFGAGGRLDRITDESGAGLIAGINQGQLHILFRYSLAPGQGPVLKRAELLVLGEQKPRQVVDYSYDEKGRLEEASVKSASAPERQ